MCSFLPLHNIKFQNSCDIYYLFLILMYFFGELLPPPPHTSIWGANLENLLLPYRHRTVLVLPIPWHSSGSCQKHMLHSSEINEKNVNKLFL